VSSNAISLNQTSLAIERAPDPAPAGGEPGWVSNTGRQPKRYRGALPMSRAQTYIAPFSRRMGQYVVPVGSGLTVDFGKWASAHGIENNYTKDQINDSRSYWFNFLPFYHMGVRTNYKVNDWLELNYWITDGTRQTKPCNGFKHWFFGFNPRPRKSVNWAINDYSPKLSLALEGDAVIERLWRYSAPSHAAGGVGYARYQMAPKFALAGRAEYLSNRGGLFSRRTQALKEATITAEYKFAEGFLMRQERRRDFSRHPAFLSDTLGILKKEQNTATLGLVWRSGLVVRRQTGSVVAQ
jgi:hypothetical protein